MPVATYRTVSTPAVTVPRKPDQPLPLYQRQAPIQLRHSTSPTSATSSVASSAVPSLTNGGRSGATSRDYESESHHGVDLIEMMTDRLHLAVNPEPLDRTIARQAQVSGELNAKQRELAELQAMAQRRLKASRANISSGMKAAREVQRDLRWTQKQVGTLSSKAASKHPQAYKIASSKYPRPISP